jgi:hypothetical protein
MAVFRHEVHDDDLVALRNDVNTQAGNKGITIKSGDDTRSLVGMAALIAGPAWSDLPAQRFVRSYHNDNGVVVTASLSADANVTSVVSTYAEISSMMRCEALSWANEIWDTTFSGSVLNTTAGQTIFTALVFDGTTAESPGSVMEGHEQPDLSEVIEQLTRPTIQ